MAKPTVPQLVLGEFPRPEALLAALKVLRSEGHPGVDAYVPYPIHGLSEAMGLPKSKIPKVAATGGLIGLGLAYSIQWWTSTIGYPINVGNRLLHSFPLFVPVSFELTVLLSALSIFFGLMMFWGLPRPHHPVFESEKFTSASTHAFWVSVPTSDPSTIETRLRALGAAHVETVKCLEGEV
jgi:hypothetical protein